MKRQNEIKRKTSNVRSKSKSSVARPSSRLSRIGIVEHTHTGQLLHHRHSSYPILVALLLVVGCLLFSTQQRVEAASQSVTVTGIVPGPAPKVGARFALPQSHITTTQSMLPLVGSCASQTLVVVDVNGQTAGSTVCTSNGAFSLPIQLQNGINILQARDFDTLNQTGPDTPFIVVDYTLTSSSASISQPKSAASLSSEFPLLRTPLFMPACYSYKGASPITTNSLGILTGCILRGVQPGQQSQLGLITYGGALPYTATINWGNQNKSVIKITDSSYQLVPFTYDSPGLYTVLIHLTDAKGAVASMQTIVEVDGPAPITSGVIGDTTSPITWIDAVPIPVYIFTLALTVCLWGIAIAERHFKPELYRIKHRKA